jgi:hypothetical protein
MSGTGKVLSVLAAEIRKLGRDMVNAMEYSAGAGSSPGQAIPPAFQLRQASKSKQLNDRVLAGDPEAIETMASSERGAAFISSTIASFGAAGVAPQILRSLPLLSRVLPYGPLGYKTTIAAKALAFTASEGASGALYGLVRPREEGESALEAAGTDAAIFVGGGFVFAGVFKALGFSTRVLGQLAGDGAEAIWRRLSGLSKPEAEAVGKRAKEILDETNVKIKEGGGDPEGLSPELATASEARAINEALDELVTTEGTKRPIEGFTPPAAAPTTGTLRERLTGVATERPSLTSLEAARLNLKNAQQLIDKGQKTVGGLKARLVGATAESGKTVNLATVKRNLEKQIADLELERTADAAAEGVLAKAGQPTPLEEVALANDALNVVAANTKATDLMGDKTQAVAAKIVQRLLARTEKTGTPILEEWSKARGVKLPELFPRAYKDPVSEKALANALMGDATTIANDIAKSRGIPIEEVGLTTATPSAKEVYQELLRHFNIKQSAESKATRVMEEAIDSDQTGAAFMDDLRNAIYGSDLEKPLVQATKTAKGRKPRKKTKLDNDPLDDVPTPWGEQLDALSTEVNAWAPLNRAHELVRELFTGVSLRKKLADLNIHVPEGTPDSELSKFLKDEAGAVSARVAGRLALTGLGTYGNLKAQDIQDDGLRDVAEAASWLAIGAGLSGFIRDGVKTNATLKRWAGWRDVRHQLSTAGSEEGANAWAGMVNVGNWEKTVKLRYLPRVYKTAQEREALGYVLTEGSNAPEWHTLSRDQQIQAAAENAYNFAFAMPWKVSRNYLTDYVSIIFPKDVARRFSDFWRANGAGRFPSLREAVNWAKANNMADPIKDGVFMQAKYTELMHKAMADVALKKTFTQMGLIAPVPKAGAALPNGWREVAGGGLAGRQMAPEDVANLLEVISQSGSLSNNKLVNAVDRIKRTYLYHINLVAIDLIRNMTLAASSVSLRHPTAWFDAMQKVVKLDPIIRDWSRHGLDVTGQVDFGPLEQAIKSIPQLNPTKNPFLKGYQFFNHMVLDIIQPGTILFAAELRKTQWLRKTGGKHLPGSPEYNAKMREIAEFANTVGGRLNQTFQHPSLKNAMKLAFFAPSWRQTRFNLLARAAGDLGDLKVFGGSKEFNEAWYLHAKMRQGLMFMGLTYGLSKILGGEDPHFDANNHRYYIRSGVFNEKGKELGIDFLGWYQDDLKLTSNPLEWVWAGANPVIKEGVEFFSGRDYNGNALTMGKRLEGLATGFGTTSAAASLLAQGVRAAMGTEDVSTADLVKTGSDVLTIPNVKTLPSHAEVTLSRVAKRILEEQGIPADRDAVYDLMQTMRGAIMRNRDLGDAILPYIAYKKRQYSSGTPFLPLIDDMKDVLEDMLRFPSSDVDTEEATP